MTTQNKKQVVSIVGYSGAGKSTLAKVAKQDPEVLTYHIATPFKQMMTQLWGVDVDDKIVRETVRPTGGQTVGELMASAFVKFREWDPNILMPGLFRAMEEFNNHKRARILLIDGVRTRDEIFQINVKTWKIGQDSHTLIVHREGLDTEPKTPIRDEVQETLDNLHAAMESGYSDVSCLYNHGPLDEWTETCENWVEHMLGYTDSEETIEF